MSTERDAVWHPHSEQVVLIGAMAQRTKVELLLEELHLAPGDFYHPANQLMWQGLIELFAVGGACDGAGLIAHLKGERLDAVGGPQVIVNLIAGGDFGGTVEAYLRQHCKLVQEAAAVRRARARIVEWSTAGASGASLAELAELARAIGDEIESGLETGDEGEFTFHDLVNESDRGYDWLIPDALEVGDVVMLTGASGSGKSLLSFQVAVQLAAGVHPFHPGRTIQPRRVLYVQAENSTREDGRRLELMRGAQRHIETVAANFMSLYPEDGLDLSTPQGMAYLRQKVRKHRPQLVVLAPWKDLHSGFTGAQGGEGDFMALKRPLDAMRRKYGFTLWIEAHTSSEAKGSQVPEHYTPRGTQAQVNWTTYGFALIPKVDENGDPIPGRTRLAEWRGPRDRNRQFPTELHEGRTWPWMPVEAAPTYNHDPLEDFDR